MRHSSIALDVIAFEQAGQQPVLGQRRDQRAVDAPGLPGGGDRRQELGGQRPGSLVEVDLVAVEMDVEGGGHASRGATTATPINSTLAAGQTAR